MANFGGGRPGGRAVGTGNKITADARAAIAAFVDNNTYRFAGWLEDVSKGIKDSDGDYIIKPNPVKAFEMLQSVLEYHVPKLARTELTGLNGGPVMVMATQQDVDI